MLALGLLSLVVAFVVVGLLVCRSQGREYGKFNDFGKDDNFHHLL